MIGTLSSVLLFELCLVHDIDVSSRAVKLLYYGYSALFVEELSYNIVGRSVA